MSSVKRHLRVGVALAAGALAFAGAPAGALAQDEEKSYDARLEGHAENVTLEGGGSALTYLLLLGLVVLGAGVMFKNAQRTHLD